jgi:hypothetical protein
MTSTFLKLAERVEKLTEPSEAMDAEILRAIVKPAFLADHITGANFTASIDAAMMLKPGSANRCGFEQVGDKTFEAFWSRNNVASGHWMQMATADTPALALTAAALRARAKEAGNG